MGLYPTNCEVDNNDKSDELSRISNAFEYILKAK